MTFQRKMSAVIASTALVFTGFAPAMATPIDPGVAAPMPIESDALGWNSENDKAERWRGYRGYRGYRRHRRHRVDAGDIIAGIAIIGGIAAIASAASKSKRDRRYEDRDYRRDDRRNNDRRSDSRSDSRSDRGTGSMDMAINACANAAERQAGGNARVSEIRSVTRDGNGWRIEGEMTNSSERTFQCGSTDGRVDFVQLGAEDLAYND